MKNVFVPAGDRGIGSELLEQLRIYGITIRDVEGLAEVERLIDAMGDGILVADVQRLDRDPSFAEHLRRLKELRPTALRLIFYSDKDDFATRLTAVRAGGEAFFQLPADAYRLADKIDALFKERDSEPFRVLVVDDDAEQLEYDKAVLERAGMRVATASEAATVMGLLVEFKPDVILMDMYMPACTGAELAAIIRQNEATASLPIIFLSVERDLEKQLSAIGRGGDEFLEKPIRPEHLAASLTLRAERARAATFFMERDYLTGLINHTSLNDRLALEALRSKRMGTVFSFAKIDLDRFKDVNERYGHLTGDRVLRSAARVLTQRLRRTDVVGRFGGEEFGAILPGTDGRSAARLIDELRESFGRLAFSSEAGAFSVSFSSGIASYPDFVGPADLLDAADRALKRAKEGGRGRVALESSRG
jgi:diguanylate cyclase (GGDEF) domain